MGFLASSTHLSWAAFGRGSVGYPRTSKILDSVPFIELMNKLFSRSIKLFSYRCISFTFFKHTSNELEGSTLQECILGSFKS